MEWNGMKLKPEGLAKWIDFRGIKCIFRLIVWHLKSTVQNKLIGFYNLNIFPFNMRLCNACNMRA